MRGTGKREDDGGADFQNRWPTRRTKAAIRIGQIGKKVPSKANLTQQLTIWYLIIISIIIWRNATHLRE